eukprot:jgi/Antlo1/687/1525
MSTVSTLPVEMKTGLMDRKRVFDKSRVGKETANHSKPGDMIPSTLDQ